ncbi:DinB family protein [Anditalea andensis]|nr:DUF1572 family protein [Anditalea andensis]
MLAAILKIIERDIDKLSFEIEQFHKEENLWVTKGGITNSSGNLCMHLIGNLKTYIGKNIGQFPYQRDREFEFTCRNIPKSKLLEEIQETKQIIIISLSNMDPDILDQPYIEDVLGFEMTNTYFLIHLTTHLSYHLGQINYLRRMLEIN